MNLFAAVKAVVTTREAAEHYGLHASRNGMCKCPFHNDKNPSMLLDERFHCFGCQADGDVINFTARLFQLSPMDAARRLASDFGIRYDAGLPYVSRKRIMTEAERLEQQASCCFRVLSDYRNLLAEWRERYAPQMPNEEWHPLFNKALQEIAQIEYLLDTLLAGSSLEKQQIIAEQAPLLPTLEQIIHAKGESSMKSTDKMPIYQHAAAYAHEHGELDLYRASHQANIACKNAIEAAISNSFDGMHLKADAAKSVLEQYGTARVAQVLAATVQTKSWDGRFSPSNKQWADSVPMPETFDGLGYDRRHEYAVTSHPAVLDGFIRLARQEIAERDQSSVKDALRQPVADKSEQHRQPCKNNAMER